MFWLAFWWTPKAMKNLSVEAFLPEFVFSFMEATRSRLKIFIFGRAKKISLNVFSGQNNNKSTKYTHKRESNNRMGSEKELSSFYSFYSNFLCFFYSLPCLLLLNIWPTTDIQEQKAAYRLYNTPLCASVWLNEVF